MKDKIKELVLYILPDKENGEPHSQDTIDNYVDSFFAIMEEYANEKTKELEEALKEQIRIVEIIDNAHPSTIQAKKLINKTKWK